jgi:ubiquinone/menaquinone biosynthesis C-methylase UbiE
MRDAEYWKGRAEAYDNLEWVKNQYFMEELVRMGEFRKTDVVLDVGTGTGIVARTVAPKVRAVIGIDPSKDMLDKGDKHKGVSYLQWDIRHPIFMDNVFDKIVARYAFHHIVKGTQKAMDECFRVLRPGGIMVLAEGVPPCEAVRQDYIDIFALKEKRITFMPVDMDKLMLKSGFRNLERNTIRLRKMSTRNWLESSGLPQETQDKIFLMHKNGRREFKQAYGLKDLGNDCLIDFKIYIVSGRK